MRRTPSGDVVLTDYGVGRIANGGVNELKYNGIGQGHIITRAPEVLRSHHANTFASDVCVNSMCKPNNIFYRQTSSSTVELEQVFVRPVPLVPLLRTPSIVGG